MDRILGVRGLTGVCVAALASGCGGSEGPERVTIVPAEVTQQGTGSISQPVYNERDDQLRMGTTTPNFFFLYSREAVAGVPENFASYKITGEDWYVVRGLTPSGEGEVFSSANGGQFARLGDTRLPAGASATYTGTYAGVYAVPGEDQVIAGHMFGSAELTANFEDGEVSGRIFDRANSGGQGAADVTLHAGTLSGGGFSGTTSGGAFAAGGFVASDGTYDGLIVGPNGEEAIGLVVLSQTSGATTHNETGGFVTER